MTLRDAPSDIWGGGGGEGVKFLLVANFFFAFARNQYFFLR